MRWLVISSVVLAVLLSVMPLPSEWRVWRPEFVALIVVYWAIYSPQYFGVFMGWLCGIFYDIVQLSPIGYNALGLLIVAYLSHLSYRRIRSYALWQQALWVFVFVGIYQLFCNWLSGLMSRSVESPAFIVTAMLTAFFWPLVVVIIRSIKIRYRIP